MNDDEWWQKKQADEAWWKQKQQVDDQWFKEQKSKSDEWFAENKKKADLIAWQKKMGLQVNPMYGTAMPDPKAQEEKKDGFVAMFLQLFGFIRPDQEDAFSKRKDYRARRQKKERKTARRAGSFANLPEVKKRQAQKKKKDENPAEESKKGASLLRKPGRTSLKGKKDSPHDGGGRKGAKTPPRRRPIT